MFFWLLTNRMSPPAVFLLPFFQLYQTIGLFDTHIAVALAHCLFNVPLAVWILEGFMSGVPKEIDETAYLDGYTFPRFFFRIFLPLIKSGVGVTAFFCFMFTWVELLLARTLTTVERQADRRGDDPDRLGRGHGLGHARGGGRADHPAGRASRTWICTMTRSFGDRRTCRSTCDPRYEMNSTALESCCPWLTPEPTSAPGVPGAARAKRRLCRCLRRRPRDRRRKQKRPGPSMRPSMKVERPTKSATNFSAGRS